jgi:hypothetical protein
MVTLVSPEAALKQAEQFEAEDNWPQAIEVLHQALQNRRNKGNNAMMEKTMVSIDTPIFSLFIIHIAAVDHPH